MLRAVFTHFFAVFPTGRCSYPDSAANSINPSVNNQGAVRRARAADGRDTPPAMGVPAEESPPSLRDTVRRKPEA